MNVKERLIRIRETVVSANMPENHNGVLWIKYNEGTDYPFSFYMHDGIEWVPVAITATGGAELSSSQIESLRKASNLIMDGDGLRYLSNDGTYKLIPDLSAKIPTRLSQLMNDMGFLTEHQKIRTINGESLVGDGDITISSGPSVTVDTELSETSENPVQNKVITSKLNELEDNALNPIIEISTNEARTGTVTSHTWDEIRKFIQNEIPLRFLFEGLDIATPIEVNYQDTGDDYYSGMISTVDFRREFRIDNSLSVDITDTYYPETFIFETETGTTGEDESVTYKVITDLDTIKSCIAAAKARKGNQRIVVNTSDGRYCEFSLVYPRTDSLRASTSFGDTGYALSLSSVEDGSTLIVKDGIIDLSDYYTKEEVDSKVASGGTFDPTAYYNKSDVDALVDAKQDKGDYALKSDIPDITDLAKKTDIPDVTGLATKSEVSLVEEQAAANAAGILEKVDKVEGKQLSTNDYTDSDKAKVDSALTEHQKIKTINGESLIGEGDISISGGSGSAVDAEFSDTSENPVQNKIVTEAITELQDYCFPTSLSASITPSSAEWNGSKHTVTVYYSVTRNSKEVTVDVVNINFAGSTKQIENVSSGFEKFTVESSGYTSGSVSVKKGSSVIKNSPRSISFNAYLPVYYGFSKATGSDIVITDLTKGGSSISGTKTISNDDDSKYLWLCVPSSMSVNKVTSSGFDVPFLSPIESSTDLGIYKCYRTQSLPGAGSITIVIS